MKKRSKAFWIWTFIGVIGVLGAVIFLSHPYSFHLNGDEVTKTAQDEPYDDPGASLRFLIWDYSDQVHCEGTVDTSRQGTYSLIYTYQLGKYSGTLTRTVEVKDMTPPRITSDLPRLQVAMVGEPYEQPVYTAIDNADGDVSDTLSLPDFRNDRYGYRIVPVSAHDEAGNEGRYAQVYYSPLEEDDVKNTMPRGVYWMDVQEDTWYLQGYVDPVNQETMELLLKKENEELSFPLEQLDTQRMGFFNGSIPLNELDNGSYQLLIRQGRQEITLEECYTLKTQLLGRMRIGDKLVSWSYDEGVSLKVEDFSYQYDIVIDVGHGNDDSGAIAVDGTYERDMNLAVALYEKQRYESFGLKVYLNRDTEEYGNLEGDPLWEDLSRVSWNNGWQGAVSRYAYSIHHNSDASDDKRGPVLLVDPDESENDLAIERQLWLTFKDLYPVMDEEWSFVTRDYVSGTTYSRADGEVYPDMRMWYGNQRIPWESFHVRLTTYEGAFINNDEDYDWYWRQGNWKKISECRIRAYVEALGKTYTPADN